MSYVLPYTQNESGDILFTVDNSGGFISEDMIPSLTKETLRSFSVNGKKVYLLRSHVIASTDVSIISYRDLYARNSEISTKLPIALAIDMFGE